MPRKTKDDELKEDKKVVKQADSKKKSNATSTKKAATKVKSTTKESAAKKEPTTKKSVAKKESAARKSATKKESDSKTTAKAKQATTSTSTKTIPKKTVVKSESSKKANTTKKTAVKKIDSKDTEKSKKATAVSKSSTTSKKSTTKTNAKKTTAKTTTKNIATKEVATKKSTTSKKTTSRKTATKTTKKSSTKKNVTETSLPVLEYYDLPYRYNQTVVKVLAQNPHTLFVYWDISDSDRENFIKNYGDNFFNITKPVLVVHNLTDNYIYEIEINDFANNWYIHVDDSKCEYSIELGRRIRQNNQDIKYEYLNVAYSNAIEIPNDHILYFKENDKIYFKNIKTNKVIEKTFKNSIYANSINEIYKHHIISESQDTLDMQNPSSDFLSSNVL